jgi:superfamily I DNA/RNA helicase
MLKPIKLTGEQKKVLFLPTTNPIQIKGVAGSGKTTVALYRAKHLLETQSNLFEEANVIIFTYNRSLSSYIESVKSKIEGGYQKDSEEKENRTSPGLRVAVTNFHRWAWWFLKERGYWDNYEIADNADDYILSAISGLRSVYPEATVLDKQLEFYREEFKWIKGKLFTEKQEYFDAARTGRGTTDRVTKEGKEILWKAYQKYQRSLQDLDLCDFDDFAIFALQETEKSSFNPPYTHIVVDEAQDLNKAQILVISKLVKANTNSISIIADAAQRIYKSGFTWSEVGINVRGGRTIEFKKNYRNTVHIARAALSLLANEPDQSEFTEVETALKGGEKTIVGYFDDWNEQIEYLSTTLDEYDWKEINTVILNRNRSAISRIREYLKDAGYDTEEINSKFTDFTKPTIKVCTLSSIKGLEFDYVFVIDLNDDVIPYPPGFNEDDDEFHISTERRLLYTAMTRARKMLYLLSSGEPTRYLAEIEEKFIEVIGENEITEDSNVNDLSL